MGEVEIQVNGARLVLGLDAALYWPAAEAVIVADLHFEKGSAYAARGVALPPYDTAATLTRLEAVLARYQPRRVISLGDAFHDDDWAARMGARDAARLSDLARRYEFIWVLGNHDPTPPSGLEGLAEPEVELRADGALVLRHEPLARTDAGFRPGELAGHLHPCGKLRQRGRNLRRRCFVGNRERLVLPAFGALTGSLNVRDAAFGALFDGTNYVAWLLGQTRIAPMPARQLIGDRAAL